MEIYHKLNRLVEIILDLKNFSFRHCFKPCLHMIENFIFQSIMDLKKPVPFL